MAAYIAAPLATHSKEFKVLLKSSVPKTLAIAFLMTLTLVPPPTNSIEWIVVFEFSIKQF